MSFFKKLFAGKGHTIEELARRLDVPVEELKSITPSYTTFTIPKRSGGHREICAPAVDLKQLQKRILHRLLSRLKAHPHAVGFERGHSIVTNAVCHVGQAVVAKLDVVDFFKSTKADRVEQYFRYIGWNREAAALLTKLCTHDGGLPAGAPTSPRLSNLVNYGLDARLVVLAKTQNATYTRYADDITISFSEDDKEDIKTLLSSTRLILDELGYKIHIRKKRRIQRRHQRQIVTGLVVNSAVQLPRTTRRWLRAVKHRAANSAATTLSAPQLQGWTALEHMIATQRELR